MGYFKVTYRNLLPKSVFAMAVDENDAECIFNRKYNYQINKVIVSVEEVELASISKGAACINFNLNKSHDYRFGRNNLIYFLRTLRFKVRLRLGTLKEGTDYFVCNLYHCCKDCSKEYRPCENNKNQVIPIEFGSLYEKRIICSGVEGIDYFICKKYDFCKDCNSDRKPCELLS